VAFEVLSVTGGKGVWNARLHCAEGTDRELRVVFPEDTWRVSIRRDQEGVLFVLRAKAHA
jgi:hypothetical protein